MDEKAPARFDWRLPLYASVGAVLIFLLLALPSWDGFIFYLPLTIVFGLILLIYALFTKRRWLSVLTMLAIYGGVSFGLLKIPFENLYDLRSDLRWFFGSKKFKAQILAQPLPPVGQLRHMEWDQWGILTSGTTTAYLVFDPRNSLAKAATGSDALADFFALPPGAHRVRRFENSWYSVIFYTSEDWDGTTVLRDFYAGDD